MMPIPDQTVWQQFRASRRKSTMIEHDDDDDEDEAPGPPAKPPLPSDLVLTKTRQVRYNVCGVRSCQQSSFRLTPQRHVSTTRR
jgi:hypothetical protein